MEQDKAKTDMVEQWVPNQMEHDEVTKGDAPVMRSKVDDLSVWQSVRQYKVIGVVAMAAAFSASMDGYRGFFMPSFSSTNGDRVDDMSGQKSTLTEVSRPIKVSFVSSQALEQR
jgi:hypothetical protein